MGGQVHVCTCVCACMCACVHAHVYESLVHSNYLNCLINKFSVCIQWAGHSASL